MANLRDPTRANLLKSLLEQATYAEEARTFLLIKPKKNSNPLDLNRLKNALERYYFKVEVM